MRRVLSIALFLLVLLPLIGPVLPGGGDVGVPVCCRVAGRHHCMGGMDVAAGTSRVVLRGARCPEFPRATVVGGAQLGVGVPRDGGVGLVAGQSAVAQAEAVYRIAWSRSQQKRGPPAVSC